jgi:hypothetical protein
MLCSLCREIDFTTSPLQVELDDNDTSRWNSLPVSLRPADISGRYFCYSHHCSLEELFQCADEGCQFCIQIRSELFHLRGHESNEDHHRGPVELRYYVHDDKCENDTLIKEVVAVVLTPIRQVRVPFDFVQYPGKSDHGNVKID